MDMLIQFIGSPSGVAEFRVQIDEGMLDSLGSDCGYVEAFWRAADEYLKLTRKSSMYGETPEEMKGWVIGQIQAQMAKFDPELDQPIWNTYKQILAKVRDEWDEAIKRIQNGSVPSLGLPGGPRVLEAKEDAPLTIETIAGETRADLKPVTFDPSSELLLIADGLDAAMNNRLADKVRSIALNLSPDWQRPGSDTRVLYSDDDGNLFNADGSQYSPWEVACPMVRDQAVS